MGNKQISNYLNFDKIKTLIKKDYTINNFLVEVEGFKPPPVGANYLGKNGLGEVCNFTLHYP
tara:strand:- start:219 stop:404 length:186 start_codon:yes stop_codon:yes gene_type:complete